MHPAHAHQHRGQETPRPDLLPGPHDTPGIQAQEIKTLSGKRSNATYWDDVRIDDRWRLGEVNGGWDVMRVALAYERGYLVCTLGDAEAQLFGDPA